MSPARYLSIPSRLRTRIGGEKERESVSVEVGAGEVYPGSGSPDKVGMQSQHREMLAEAV